MDMQALIEEFRRRSDDYGDDDALVSDSSLTLFASEAETEAAIRADLLYDDSTAFITTIAVVAGQHTYTLHESVHRVDAAHLTLASGGRARELDLTGMDALREEYDWADREGRPCKLVHGQGTARLWPTPTQAGTLQLAVYRKPLYPIEDLQDEPEIAEEHHLGLIDWMLYRAYGTKDGEAGDDTRSSLALAEFEARFGERDNADVQRRHRERRRVTTRCL